MAKQKFTHFTPRDKPAKRGAGKHKKNKNKQEKSDERKVWYTGATRARKTLHLLRTDYKFNYPIGSDYLIYVQEKNDK